MKNRRRIKALIKQSKLEKKARRLQIGNSMLSNARLVQANVITAIKDFNGNLIPMETILAIKNNADYLQIINPDLCTTGNYEQYTFYTKKPGANQIGEKYLIASSTNEQNTIKFLNLSQASGVPNTKDGLPAGYNCIIGMAFFSNGDKKEVAVFTYQ